MSSSVEEWLDRQDHPLMNNVVLNAVFKHLRGKDLKECRLVCKTWHTLTIPFIRNTYEVTIFGNDKMDEFVALLRSNDLGLPYAKFQIGPICMTDGIGQEFLELCGDEIKSVRCFSSVDYAVEDMSALLKSTPRLEMFETASSVACRNKSVINLYLFPEVTKPKLPSLKKLTVSEYCYGGRIIPKTLTKFCPTYLEELITAAENISSLHLADYNSFEETSSPTATFQVLSLIEKLGRESSIQELTILYNRTRDYSKYIELLHKMTDKPNGNGLKLKKFEYAVCKSDEECQDLFQLISLFKDTLEYLDINQKYSNALAMFLKMSRLRNLSVQFERDFNSRCVNLKRIFPVLEKLELEHYDVLKEFFPNSEPCGTVNSLIIHKSAPLNINGFKQVLSVFPNLTTLSVYIEDDGVLVLLLIWSQMTGLKSLSISGTMQSMTGLVESLDSCLIGTGNVHLIRALPKIRELFNPKNGMSVVAKREMLLKLRSQRCQLPSIVGLTGLRRLTLSLALSGETEWHRASRQRLTDLTGYLGFYCMTRLKHLTIENCGFTKACCETLTKDLGLESWAFRTSCSKEIIPSS